MFGVFCEFGISYRRIFGFLVFFLHQPNPDLFGGRYLDVGGSCHVDFGIAYQGVGFRGQRPSKKFINQDFAFLELLGGPGDPRFSAISQY